LRPVLPFSVRGAVLACSCPLYRLEIVDLVALGCGTFPAVGALAEGADVFAHVGESSGWRSEYAEVVGLL
jgi:hypothetical protein